MNGGGVIPVIVLAASIAGGSRPGRVAEGASADGIESEWNTGRREVKNEWTAEASGTGQGAYSATV